MTPVIKQVLQYGNKTVEYDVIKSKRVKTSEIIVDENRIVIRTPSNKPQSEIHQIIEKKVRWILDKQKQYSAFKKEINKPVFESGSTLPYLGRNYPLEIRENSGGEGNIRFQRGKFVFLFSTNEWTRNQIKSLYEEWLKQRAQKIFSNKVKEYSKELKIEIQKIVIKNLRNRWGSVTKEGVLNLNVNLLKSPSKVIDYIIIHEMCHIKFKAHSHHFWSLVHKIMPGYNDIIVWLERNASSLIE
jgi:predicted metal-dependent hydrolase